MTKALLGAALVVALLGSTTVANAVQRNHDMSGGPHFGDIRGDVRGHDRDDGFRGERFFRTPGFHGDRDGWRGGSWRHERHDGRFGWWWVAGDFWTFYPEPIYPYPNFTYDGPATAAGGVWFYCTQPPGYYPDVSHCETPWKEVPATPQ